MQNLSFFLAGFLLSAWLIQLLWNWLRKDMTVLPRLSYFRAVALVGLWGLLFILVLTMISGARELMTPGAWEPNGITYKLAPKAGPPQPDETRGTTNLGAIPPTGAIRAEVSVPHGTGLDIRRGTN